MAATGQGLPIRIRGVSKAYGGVLALDDLSLDIGSGSFITLLGPSGSGKTTLLMILAGFVRPDAGDVLFGNESIVRLAPHKRNLGVVFQNYALFPHMTVFGNLAFPLRLRKMGKGEIADRVRRVLELVQLDGFEGRRVDELSGGQRQRVALARAIVFQPRALLMDEPLSALDKKLRERMQIEIRHLHERLGVTTIYVTHDQREALTMSDRIAVIDGGRLRQFGSPQEIYEQPASCFVADFIGDSSFVPVTIEDGAVRLDGRPLKLACPPEIGIGTPRLLIRPEKLEIIENECEDDERNRLRGTVVRSIYQGESFLVHVVLSGGGQVAIRGLCRQGPQRALPEVGKRILLGLHPADTRVIFSGQENTA